VIIPRTENTIKCRTLSTPTNRTFTDICLDINSELDELDREEFFRLKKVQNKKQRDTAKQDAEMRAKREAAEQRDEDKENEGTGGGDILGEEEDADVIF
jgi:V-type H+-transporting ATPase subunit D